MKRSSIVFILLALITFKSFGAGSITESASSIRYLISTTKIDESKLKEGDLIFHESVSEFSTAIQLATNSIYSHCGILVKENNRFYVLEAIQPVGKTLLADWIARGKDGKYVIKRLKEAEQLLTVPMLNKIKEVGKSFEGKDYDSWFAWSDSKIYCSELIWKIYKRAANIEIGKLEKLKDFDFSSDLAKKYVKLLYGDNLPKNETVISPISMFNSDLLYTISKN
ncbi:YiiX family permuted papain-like enzyme [Sphingobacterium hungaricum]|uniref:Peptidoglycan peptidase n=1 Tax=Sphingobacterium hungaricum TaxID=2082723 RepID=A0A928V1A7_9SPHI|nr:YiiX family permuted papain-like enzyme [Sphingobacterium hungaricum]MBE8715161.1 peptidoglycan peptidase [Sphingobacterium hungaricum]